MTASQKKKIEKRILPAEWERHEATYLAWPHNRTDWPGKLNAVVWAFVEIIRKIETDEEVRVLVADKGQEERAKRTLLKVGSDLSRVRFLPIATDRSWVRDSGPLFVRKGDGAGGFVVTGFNFNGWARYKTCKRDALVARKIATMQKSEYVAASFNDKQVTLEGGAIDVNGAGTLVTTEECLLDQKMQTRNPNMSRADYEKVFHDYLGVANTIWLAGGIAGDDTHGHVDDICRFVNQTTLVAVTEERSSDANYRSLQENLEILQTARLENGAKPEVVKLPSPSPLYFDGQRLPASYANFYIANAAVLVPTFNDPADSRALGILGELFRDRPVVGIHSTDLAQGLGAIHCLTMQHPAG